MKLSVKTINRVARKYSKKAHRAFLHKQYDTCIEYLKAASHTRYNFYMGFRDEEYEKLLFSLSRVVRQVDRPVVSQPNECVFFDSFSIDSGGLVQQYLAAIIFAGYKVHYITERKGFLSHKSAIRTQLEEGGVKDIIEVPSKLSGMARAQFIYDVIVNSGASKLFMQTNPSAVCPIVAFLALPSNIIRYKINLTDHAFWIGASCIDYSLEFRPRGCVLSEYARGVSHEKIFLLPFYPIVNSTPFGGFPKETDGKILILSGGAFYKVYDENDTFFKLAQGILEHNQNAVILFAGEGDRQRMYEKLQTYSIEKRFILIGQRKDIAEVFKHIDIYLDTFPLGGGLMCQLAAFFSKPILAYSELGSASVEEYVCQTHHTEIAKNSIESVIAESCRLVQDVDYRQKVGKQINSCVVDSEKFNGLFFKTMESSTNQVPYTEKEEWKENPARICDKILYENKEKQYQRSIVKIFGFSALWKCPGFLLDSIGIAIRNNRVLSVIKNNI